MNSDDNTILDERNNILTIIDSFIEQIAKIRRFFIGVSISSIILAPIAITLALYLFTHQSFFRIVEAEREYEFDLIIIFSILFVTGILQYRQIGSWHKKYESYKKEKDDINQYIANKFKN